MQFFRTLIGSFYSAALYRAVRREIGYKFGYSFLLVALTTLILTLAFTWFLHQIIFVSHDGRPPVFEDTIHQIAAQLPIMTVKDGTLMTQYPAATRVHLKTTVYKTSFDKDIITIDTTGATTHESMNTPMLITAHEVVIDEKNEKKIHALKDYTGSLPGPLVINRALIDETAEHLITITHRNLAAAYMVFISMGWILFTLVFYILRVIMLLALGGSGFVAARLTRHPVDYATAVRLAAVSYTPIAILAVVMLGLTGHFLNVIVLFVGGLAALLVALAVSRDDTLADPR